MRIIKENIQREKEEAKERIKAEQYNKMIEEGRESDYGVEVLRILEEEINITEKEIQRIQVEEMKNVFLLKKKEQEETIKRMSNRHLILNGVKDILKNTKNRL